jgi:GTP pyrophosphokinase
MISDARKKKIEKKYQELLDICKTFSSKSDLENIEKAYDIAFKAELEKYKTTGELNIMHSLEIAQIAVNEIGLGAVAVCCTLLHNLVETNDITVAEIELKFGKNVATIVRGFFDVSNLNTGKISAQSDNFRKLFLTIVDDIRVILIKISHRLYDMRNYDKLSALKQEKYLDEVVHIYIPIAHRLGLYALKSDIEELSMKYSHPEIYNSIQNRIKASKTKQNVFLNEFINPIQRELISQGLDCEFKARPKSVSSIWTKMKRQNVSFEEVYDLFAIRIISNSKQSKEKEDCWRIYSVVTDIYQPNPKRLRDWISTPKASGYESLHTTVKGPNKHWVEVQIRSKRMDENAERGQAAHWRYKGFGSKEDSESWLNQVRDILDNPEQIQFDGAFDSQKLKKSNKIFVFTPSGDLKQLPTGSTVLDFAYEIHTNIGSKCNGARVNNKIVPIRHELNNGDKVEIITAKNQKPKLDWLNFVISSKAKTRIKRAMLEEKYKEAELGSEILKRKLKSWKIPFNDETVDKIIRQYKFKSSIDLYFSIATEKLDIVDVRKLLKDIDNNNGNGKSQRIEYNQVKELEKKTEKYAEDSLMINDKLKNVNYSLAKCCNPIIGDSVFGFVTVGKGITIHRVNCPNASQMLKKYRYRIIDVKWQDTEGIASSAFSVKIKVIGEDEIGIVGEITNTISKDLKVNMQSVSVETFDNGTFEGKIKVHIKDNKHLDELIHKLLKLKGVDKVSRMENSRK